MTYLFRTTSLVAALLFTLAACDNAGESVSETESAPIDYAALLQDSSWELTRIVVLGGFEFTPEVPADYTLRFRSENRLTGKSDCNTFTANWNVGDDLTISNFSPTRSMCIAGSLHNYFSLYVRDVVSMQLADDSLVLGTTTEGVRLEFRPAS